MKVGIVFIGAIREQLKNIKNNIFELKQCFPNDEVTVIFSTWYPNKENYSAVGNIIWTFDYDLAELESELDGVVDVKILLHQKPMSEYKCHNTEVFPVGYPLVYMYHLIEVAKYLKKNNYNFEHIVRSRHDNLFKMQNAEKYFNDKISIPRLYWGNINDLAYNDHFFISTYKDFLKFSDITEEKMNEYCQDAHSGENLNYLVLNDIAKIEFIADEDIIQYVNRGTKFFK